MFKLIFFCTWYWNIVMTVVRIAKYNVVTLIQLFIKMFWYVWIIGLVMLYTHARTHTHIVYIYSYTYCLIVFRIDLEYVISVIFLSVLKYFKWKVKLFLPNKNLLYIVLMYFCVHQIPYKINQSLQSVFMSDCVCKTCKKGNKKFGE